MIFAGYDQVKEVVAASSLAQASDGSAVLNTLDLFSYGTYHDCISASSAGKQYLSLSDSQIFKIRQLTVLTLVQQACTVTTGISAACIPYETMARELGFITPESQQDPALWHRQVEDVVISCLYAKVIAGKLCQKTKRLVLSSDNGPPCRPRDVHLDQIGNLLSQLESLSNKIQQTNEKLTLTSSNVQSQVLAQREFTKSLEDRKKSRLDPASAGRDLESTARLVATAAAGGPSAAAAAGDRTFSGTASSRRQKRSRGGGLGQQFGRI